MIPVDPCGMAMSDVRHCYEAWMTFPGVGDVKVRWYYTDKDYLPYPHVYGSADNNADKPADYDDREVDIGEDMTRPRPRRDGKPPLPCDCTGPRGSPEAWAGLSDASSPLFSCPGWGAAYNEDYNEDYDSLTFAEE